MLNKSPQNIKPWQNNFVCNFLTPLLRWKLAPNGERCLVRFPNQRWVCPSSQNCFHDIIAMKQAELLKSITARCDRIFVIILCRLSNIKLCVQVGKYLQCVGCNVHNSDHCNIHVHCTLCKHTNVFVPICAALVGWRRLKAVVTEFPGKREVFSREERGEEERLSQSKGSLSWMYRALQKSLLLEMIVFFIELQYMYYGTLLHRWWAKW